MSYVGEISSPFGAHGLKNSAHKVRSPLGEVSSPFGAHGVGAHRVRSMLGYVGEVSSPFGAHGVGAHRVRSMLGSYGVNGLGDAGSLALAKAQKEVARAEQNGNMSLIAQARSIANAVAAAVTSQKSYDAQAVAIRQPLLNMPKSVQDAAVAGKLGPRPTIPSVPTISIPVPVKTLPSPAADRPTDGGGAPPVVVDAGGGGNTMLYVGGAIAVIGALFLLKR